jgi:hypothetical protein
MKCVKNNETGEVKRVPNPALLIAKGWVYCSKQEWKATGRGRKGRSPHAGEQRGLYAGVDILA